MGCPSVEESALQHKPVTDFMILAFNFFAKVPIQ